MHKKLFKICGGKIMLTIFCLIFFCIVVSAQTTYYVNDASVVADVITTAVGNDLNAGTSTAPFASFSKAISVASAGDIIKIDAGVYAENVSVTKSLTFEGADSSLTILDKGDANYTALGGNGFTIAADNVTIKKLKIKNFNHAINNTIGISNLVINTVTMIENFSTGFYPSASVNTLTITNCIMRNNAYKGNVSSGGFGRAVFLQAGASSLINISITNNIVTDNALVGIDVNLANLISGITITSNTLTNNGDAELSIWLGKSTPTSNAVLIDNNNITLTKNERFGIEIKNPNGTGKSSGVGSIVVSNNIINVSGHLGATRDMGGIVVIRRKDADATVNDQPQGVVISGNTINNMQNINANTNDAYAIAVGGTGHKISGNTITNAEISIQLQKGNDGYTTDGNSNQANVDFFFSRDNSKDVCVEFGSNTITSSGAARLVTDVATSTLTLPSIKTTNTNLGTSFCTLQQAIDFAATVAGHTITAQTGTYDEQVIVNKELTLDGVDSANTIVAYTGTVAGSAVKSLFTITAQNVTIKNFKFNVDFVKVHSAIVSSGNVSGLTIMGNYIKAAYPGTGTTLSYGTRNAININLFNTLNATAVNSEPLIQNVTIKANTIDSAIGTGSVLFRSGISADRIRNLTIGGNSASDANNFVMSINHDIITRFYYGTQTIKNNQLKGGGIEMSSPQEAGASIISNNTFNGLWSKGNAWAMLRILNGYAARTINVSNNQFIDQKWGASFENTENVVIDNNSFTASVNNFRLISINTKLRTNGASPTPLDIIDAKLTNNTFSTSGIFVAGNAVEFLNFDQQSENNYRKGVYTIGTLGNENTFNANIPQYIAINNINGVSTQNVGFTTLYPEYNDGGLSTGTTTGYWTKNVDARNNRFFVAGSLKLATTLSAAEMITLSASIFDKKDDANIGLVVLATPTWTGALNTDWSNVANWSNGLVPDTDLDAVIPAVINQPTLTATANCDSLVLNVGATLTTANNTLNVYGDIRNNGTIDASLGTIILSNSVVNSNAQNIAGGIIVKNLTLNNINGATIAAGVGNTITLLDTYTPTIGTLTTNSNLLLKSTVTGTARIAAGTGSYLSGNVTVQRFVQGGASNGTPGKRAFRFFSHPFSSYTDLRQLTTQIDITGSGATAIPSAANFTQSGSNAASAFWFNPLVADGALNDAGWQSFTNALPLSGSDANAWQTAQGIRVLVRGAKGEGLAGGSYTASDVTLSMRGAVNAGNTVNTTLTKNGLAGGGWNLVGNPFPSQIEIQNKLNALRATNTGGANSNIGATAYVWNPNKTGTSRGGYDAIDLTVASNYYLPMNGVLVVQTTTNGNTALSFSEADKSNGAGSSIFRTSNVNNAVSFMLTDVVGNELDETMIRVNSKSKKEFESNDGGKLINDYAIYTLTADRVMAYTNSQPELVDGMMIPVGIYSSAAKELVIKINELNLQNGLLAYLKDNFLNKEILIADKNFTYNFSTTADDASKGNGRFELLFKNAPTLTVINNFTLTVSPNPAIDQVTVSFNNEEVMPTTIQLVSVDGKVIRTVNAGNVQQAKVVIAVKGFAKGSYIVSVNNGKSTTNQQLQIQ